MARVLSAIVGPEGTLRGIAGGYTRPSGKILFKIGASSGSPSITVAKQTRRISGGVPHGDGLSAVADLLHVDL
jgi:hypothetical protein